MEESQRSTALTRLSSDSSLMPPPPPVKRIKRPAKVLDEDDYTDALSHIIARDFFPGLLETESKQEYLDALSSRDNEWIAAAGERLTEMMTPGPQGRKLRGRRGTSMATPLLQRATDTPRTWRGETPMSVVSTASTATHKSENPDIDVNMSLGAFQQKYTSEDNESFYKLMDKQNHKRAERYSWMWSRNKILSARQIAYRKREQLEAGEKAKDELENGKTLMRLDDGDKRPAMPDTWTGRPSNPFMFAPDSVEDTHQTVAQKNQETSAAPPKAVIYDNTRLPSSRLGKSTSGQVPPSPSLSAVKDAIAGNPRPTASEVSSNDLSLPQVNGYTFVDSEEPETDPAQEAALQSLLMSTNGARNSGNNPFKLQQASHRESLHHRMVDKVAKGKRISKNNSVQSPLPGRNQQDFIKAQQATPRFMSSPRIEKRGGLTPAAEMLLGKVGKSRSFGTATSLRGNGIWDGGITPKGSSLRNMVTPKAGR